MKLDTVPSPCRSSHSCDRASDPGPIAAQRSGDLARVVNDFWYSMTSPNTQFLK